MFGQAYGAIVVTEIKGTATAMQGHKTFSLLSRLDFQVIRELANAKKNWKKGQAVKKIQKQI